MPGGAIVQVKRIRLVSEGKAGIRVMKAVPDGFRIMADRM